MRSILVVALLLLASAANAGTITLTVTRASGTCSTPCTKTYTDTDAALARLVPAYQNPCNVSINGTCTPVQVLNYIFNRFITELVSDVKAFENKATLDAVVLPTPINPQ